MLKPLRILVFIMIFLLWRGNCLWASIPDGQEIKAMWVTRFQLDSKEKIDRFVTKAKENGFNMLFVQVLGRGEAYYRSSILPTVETGFDPLAETVEKSRRQGIKVHAWLNAYYVWSSPEAPSQLNHVVNAKPHWLLPKTSNMLFLNPANKGVQDHLYSVYLEVARNYDVDGIHFDYIRYPDHSFVYDKKNPAYPIAAKRRADDVTGLVKRIYQEVKKLKPGIAVSAAVYPDIFDASTDKGQDWRKWQKDGIIDFTVPMIYSRDPVRVLDLILLNASVSSKNSVVLGLGAFNNPADVISDHIKTYKYYKRFYKSLKGFSLFSYDSLSDSPGYFEKIRKDVL